MAWDNIKFIKMLDKSVAGMLTTVPSLTGGSTSATTPGYGNSALPPGDSTDYGLQLKWRNLEDLVLGFQDAKISLALLSTMDGGVNAAPYQKRLTNDWGSVMAAYNTLCSQAGLSGVTSLETFAQYYNTGAGGNWQSLLPPDYRTLYNALYSAFPSPFNVYAPPVLASTGLGNYASAAWNNGSVVDTAKYAGHIQVFGVVTSPMTIAGGAGTIVLSANGFTASGTAGAPASFTGTPSSHPLTCSVTGASLTSGTILVFTGSAADIYTAITNATLTNISGGTFWIGGMSPTAAPSSAPAGVTGANVPSGATRQSPPV
jgi:hypothetical protein